MVLNNVGTFQNAGQDNVAVYYYPYDDNGEVELYYVEVFSAANLDVPQFVREAWPNVIGSSDPTNDGGNGGFTNQLSNPQFVDVLFNTTSGLDITYSGNTVTTQQIAPDWFLKLPMAVQELCMFHEQESRALKISKHSRRMCSQSLQALTLLN